MKLRWLKQIDRRYSWHRFANDVSQGSENTAWYLERLPSWLTNDNFEVNHEALLVERRKRK